MSEKSDAFAFLRSLEELLCSRLCEPEEMRLRILENRQIGKTDPSKKHWSNNPEAAFLNSLVMPELFNHVKNFLSDNDGEIARQSLWADYGRSMQGYVSGSSARTKSHPFGKRFVGESVAQVMTRWRGQDGKPFVQPYPDIILNDPFPHRIVFEGKYFSGGDAEKALVESIYETCFYLGLPFVPATIDKPAWAYDYGCFIAYDASENGSLRSAWDSVVVKECFWNSANVYVMVLGAPSKVKYAPEPIAQTRKTPISQPMISPKAATEQMVTAYLPNARETPNSLIALDEGGITRWFDKRTIFSFAPHPKGGFEITTSRRAFAKRNLLSWIKNEPSTP